jgi:HTH-like domain
MSQVVSPVNGRPYGLAAVCRAWRIGRSGVYRRQAPAREAPPRRRGPTGAMSDDALTVEIRAVLAASRFHGEGHRKVWARLRHAGARTSRRRVLRLMREHDLLAPSRAGSPRGPRNHDGTITPETVDTMWGTDLTTAFTDEGQAAVFIAVDHCSAARHPFRGAGADPPGRAPTLRCVRQRDRARPVRPARSRVAIHVRSLPEGTEIPRDGKLAGVRPRARGKRLRRAVHSHAQGESAVAPDLRDDRGTTSGIAGLQGNLQHHLADRTPRLHLASAIPTAAASTHRKGSLGFNPVSQKPRAVQHGSV